MAKTINLDSAKVIEVILRPDEAVPLAVAFELLDDDGKPVMTKHVTVKREDLTAQALTAVANLVERITTKITTLEGL